MINLEYYILLEINPNATQDEIKKAYRKKAHELHPDKNKGVDTTKKFQELNNAYQALRTDQFENSSENDLYNSYSFYDDDNSNLFEANIYIYDTNIETLTCKCNDFKEKRYMFPKYDPRRLCRHLIAKFSVLEIEYSNSWITPYNIYDYNKSFYSHSISKLNIPIFLEPFRDEITSNYRNNYRLSLNKDIQYIFLNHSIINIYKYEKEIVCKLKNRNEYITCDFDGNVTVDCNTLIESENFNEAMVYLKKNMNIDIYYNLNIAIINAKIERFKDINDAWEKGFLLSKEFNCNFLLEIPKSNTIEQNKIDLQKITDNHKMKFNNYLIKLNEFESEYDTTQNLLKHFNSTLSTLMFNKLLKDMGFLTKDINLNYNDWIIIRDGNNYGMNYIRSSIYSHISVPDWYIIKFYDYETLSLKVERRYGLQKMTIILWEKSSFQNLLSLINEHKLTYENKLKEKSKLKIKEKNEFKEKKENIKKEKTINLERELWLKNVECEYCHGKNIHKKDKRQRINYKVQRYMCMDCNKIFQKIIEENY